MFAGIVMRRGGDPRACADAHTLLAALDPYEVADRKGQWTGDGAMLVQALTWNSRASLAQATPTLCTETKRVFVGWTRIDNRAALCAQLGLDPSAPMTDADVILAAHRVWGEDCADRLEGDFAFVIYDPAHHGVFCARDAVGTKPLFYHLSADLFIFSSTAAIFPILRGFDATPSREWIARFLIGESADPVKSAFAHVVKLAPAHMLTVTREGSAEPRRYFAFSDTAPFTDRRDEKYVDAYRAAFHHAVETRLDSDYQIAAENSGGIDSATILGHAVSVLPGGGRDITCFSLCHMEREAAPIFDVAMHCGIKESHVLTRPAYQPEVDAQARALRVMGYPPEHNLVEIYVPFFERCRSANIRTMLSGFGGDEIVTAQGEFVPRELLLRRRYRAALDIMPGAFPMRLARTVKTVLDGMGSSRHAVTPRLARTMVKREVIKDLGLTGFEMDKARAFGEARTMGEYLLAKPAFARAMVGRLEGFTLMAASYGVDYRWPMLDRQLMERYFATPSIEKRNRQFGRYLHRRACDKTIPDSILWKKRKDLGGIAYLGRDWRFKQPDLQEMPDALTDIIDVDAVRHQCRLLAASSDEWNLWSNMRTERNNLRDLTTLFMWLKT